MAQSATLERAMIAVLMKQGLTVSKSQHTYA
jgi:hypothetical protein